MAVRFMLTEYVQKALTQAVYDKLEDGSYVGKIPACQGVIAFAKTLRKCEEELHSTLEEWIWLGLKQQHPLPVIGHIDLNREPDYESMEPL